MRRIVRYFAPAKLNLALSVGPPLGPEHGSAAGMHPICSWMVTVNLFDDLTLTRLENDRISRYAILWHADAKRRSKINWPVTSDLAVRAHLAMQQHVGRNLPVQMKLEKRIPVGGGLGGGSSDAAAMLRALNDLFELNVSMQDLNKFGATLGSDVPFLVHGGSAIVNGLGDQITHQPSSGSTAIFHAVIVFPAAVCPTAQVYRRFDELSDGRAELLVDRVRKLFESRPHSLTTQETFNDLMPAAIETAPVLQEHLDELANLAERPALVTGSGSSLFVICDDETHATALAAAVEQQLALPAVAVRSCEIPAPETSP